MCILRAALVFCMIVFGAGTARGQDYPGKLIRIISSAGGGNEAKARFIAQGIAAPLGQQVIVDPRATPIIAAETVAKAPPDGYTLLVGGASLWLMPLMQKVSYDPIRDFSPISLMERSPSILVAHPSLPVKSVKELISLAKARPGDLNYSSAAPGSTSWLAGALFKSMGGVNIVSVTYKGGGPALTALISGEVQLMFTDPESVMAHVKAGRLKALAVTSATPSALAPGLPTMAGSGLPGYELTGATSILAPAKTPEVIINRLNREVVRALNLPDMRERFLNAGAEIVANSPEQFAAVIRADTDRISKVIKEAGIKAD